ncbi:hypothetical protein [Chitinibacter tainanensis]|uniref:hypothetical protein n=1 Tax=Chitinibacter tainanensis TaxID=230667 RepID=UPI000557D7C8|nr:hypothetical protein [Chitinibacter tainanensis]
MNNYHFSDYPSANVGDNAHYMHCPTLQNQQGYAVCCHKVSKHYEGKLPSIYNDCAAAIEKNTCRAKQMMDEERGAGYKAIYFVSRAAIKAEEEARQAERKQVTVWGAKPASRFALPSAKPVLAQSKKDSAVKAPETRSELAVSDMYSAVVSELAKQDSPVSASKTAIPDAKPDFNKWEALGENFPVIKPVVPAPNLLNII